MNAERARQLFDYDPLTGVLSWHANKGRAKAGEGAGSEGPEGYRQVKADGQSFTGHRLIWLWVTGEWPAGEVDHEDTDPRNNRWINLRAVPQVVNRQNQRKPRADSVLRVQGVRRHRGKFQARITVDRRQRHIGLFDTAELAHEAYVKAKRQLHQGCTL